jgi:hypothetical protein
MLEMKNCWEFKNCGREPGGIHINERGVCPAATNTGFHAVNRGKAGGRFCWNIDGTLCNPTSGAKPALCTDCAFFLAVQQQEGRYFVREPRNLSRPTGLADQEIVDVKARHGHVGRMYSSESKLESKG